MIKDGEKGAVLQVDRQTYGIAPHIPCGLLTPGLLRSIADVADKYGVRAIKITGATRIALLGLKEEDLDGAWSDLGMDPGRLVGLCVRSVRCCPGNTYCRLGQADAIGMGLELDRRYHGVELPNKMKMAVSGCPINCAEGWVRDVGLYAQGGKWTLLAGGNVGSRPRLALEIVKGLDNEGALSAVTRLVDYYRQNAGKGQRMGRMIEKTGIEPLIEAVRA